MVTIFPQAQAIISRGPNMHWFKAKSKVTKIVSVLAGFTMVLTWLSWQYQWNGFIVFFIALTFGIATLSLVSISIISKITLKLPNKNISSVVILIMSSILLAIASLIIYPISYSIGKVYYCENFGCEVRTILEKGPVKIDEYTHEWAPIRSPGDGAQYTKWKVYVNSKLKISCKCEREDAPCLKDLGNFIEIKCMTERYKVYPAIGKIEKTNKFGFQDAKELKY
jgi:hypothetical protein